MCNSFTIKQQRQVRVHLQATSLQTQPAAYCTVSWVLFVKLQPDVLHSNILRLSHCSRHTEPAVAHTVLKIAEGLCSICMSCLLLVLFALDAQVPVKCERGSSFLCPIIII